MQARAGGEGAAERPWGTAEAHLRRDERRHLEIVRASAEVLCHTGLRLPAHVKVAVGLEGGDELQVLGRGAVLRCTGWGGMARYL